MRMSGVAITLMPGSAPIMTTLVLYHENPRLFRPKRLLALKVFVRACFSA